MARLDNKNILIVEDDALLSTLLSKKLIEENAVMEHAADGEAALAMIKAKRYDLIILDLLLPKVDGYAVLSALNVDPVSKGTPVIVLSNLGQKSDVEKGIALGVKKFLVKAVLSLDEVVDATAEVLK
jgi:DNA-binding response OmpR family regulator